MMCICDSSTTMISDWAHLETYLSPSNKNCIRSFVHSDEGRLTENILSFIVMEEKSDD